MIVDPHSLRDYIEYEKDVRFFSYWCKNKLKRRCGEIDILDHILHWISSPCWLHHGDLAGLLSCPYLSCAFRSALDDCALRPGRPDRPGRHFLPHANGRFLTDAASSTAGYAINLLFEV